MDPCRAESLGSPGLYRHTQERRSALSQRDGSRSRRTSDSDRRPGRQPDRAVRASAIEALSLERIARLWRVEPEFREFLLEYRASAEYRKLRDGARLRQRFEEAGFGDFFYAPGGPEWQTLRTRKLPDLDSPLAARLAVDTHMSLLADGDFVNQQEAIDAALLKRTLTGTNRSSRPAAASSGIRDT